MLVKEEILNQTAAKPKVFTVEKAIEILKTVNKDCIIMFLDLDNKKSDRKAIKDIIIQEETYPFADGRKVQRIIFVNHNLNLGDLM